MGDDNYDNVDVKSGLKTVLAQMEAAVARRSKDLPQITPKLLAVTKIKPVSLILEAYEAGQRHFGENYVNELTDKANDPKILEKCKDIKWHFIGHLQSNKINKLLNVPNLYFLQTLDSTKLADQINKQWAKIRKEEVKLNVFVQVNTSEEEVKSGVEPSQVNKLVEHVLKDCPYLDFKGLMTIGKYDYNMSFEGINHDFLTLSQCRQEVCKKFNLEINDIELSMGMSMNFEQAIELGATIVRVGQNIFGKRRPKGKDWD